MNALELLDDLLEYTPMDFQGTGSLSSARVEEEEFNIRLEKLRIAIENLMSK